MIFEVEDIPEGGLSLNLFEPKGQFEINQPDCSLSDDIKLKGRLTRIEQDVCFSGELQAILQLACARCLTLFFYNVETRIKVNFVPSEKKTVQGNEIEIKQLDIEKEIYEGHQVDLKCAVRDQILLEVPLMHFCREDCKGLCSECGIDLNSSQCECQNGDEIDSRFAVLRTIKNIEIGRDNGSPEEKNI